MEENLKQQQSDIIKIALLGPKSSSKSDLTKQLADYFDTTFVSRFAKEYLDSIQKSDESTSDTIDLIQIAIAHVNAENQALLSANQLLLCDTCVLETKLYFEEKYQLQDPLINKVSKKHKYDLFILTDSDVSSNAEQQELNASNRDDAFMMIRKTLSDLDKPFVVLRGDLDSRFRKAVDVIKNLIEVKKTGFSSQDFVSIYKRNVEFSVIKSHLKLFSEGITKSNIIRPAIVGDGIFSFSKSELDDLAAHFHTNSKNLKIMKFVPASGAASRMFKFLNEFLTEFDRSNDTINSYINRKNSASLAVFLAGIDKFPFYETIKDILIELNPEYFSWSSDEKHYYFIKMLLDPEFFNFSNKPKAILPFHRYSDHTATPIEEHLMEAAVYANSNGISNLHFTISEIHKSQFEKIIEKEVRKVEQKFNTEINIEFSFQSPSTDTLAVCLDNEPFRTENGELLFRPAGHGALINNLNNIDADVIFIKNIDNVIQNHIDAIALYKKALGGYLLRMQKRVHDILEKIENEEIHGDDLPQLIRFLQNELSLFIIDDFHKYTFENKIAHIKGLLNRPIRVCGMVKNEGEPGGGPFWTLDNKGQISLQIVEASQIDMQNTSQANLFSKATHFNPVDIVCTIKDFKGNKFDLNKFVDHESGFIVQKNKSGKEIKAYELPGLWNGGMANWVTIFVEVPLITFNPVKTVNDLLKPAHQPQ